MDFLQVSRMQKLRTDFAKLYVSEGLSRKERTMSKTKEYPTPRENYQGGEKMAKVKLMRAEDRQRGTTQTPGMSREQAFSDDIMWSGYVHTAARMTSGWHHHNDYDTVVYVVSGALRMESGEDGKEIIDAKPGDFVFIPRHTIHRESNPSTEEAGLVVVRVGSGSPVVNVDAPEKD